MPIVKKLLIATPMAAAVALAGFAAAAQTYTSDPGPYADHPKWVQDAFQPHSE